MTRWQIRSAVAVGLALIIEGFAAPVATAAEPFVLGLTPRSSFESGCFPPCLCPLQLIEGMKGTLKFELVDSNPLFSTYAVTAALTVPRDPPAQLEGTGTYTVGGEVAITQELTLNLSTDGGKVETFSSRVVLGGGEFPDSLSISLSIGQRECFDTVLNILAEPEIAGEQTFVRGDCNADSQTDISDAVSSLIFLFAGGARPPCTDACDANDDGKLDLSDAVATLGHLFLGTGPLPPPSVDCGVDPSQDELACDAFPPCAGSACDAAIAAIAAETQIVGSCSAVVRLDYISRTILSWQLICGRYSQVTEEVARERAKIDAGYGGGQMLSPASPVDAFVFYESPGDFGGAGIVSARTGLTLFGGSIVWDGRGEVTYPREWRPAATLGVDCKPFQGPVETRAYDLAAGAAELPLDVVEDAMTKVRQTAIFDGMSTSGYVFDAVVVLYPRSVGVFDPTTAELIVLVNGGWLE